VFACIVYASLSLFYRANWVKVNGTHYQTPCALVVGKSDDEDLLFGNVNCILVHKKQVYFEFELMETQFCNHYHAYALSLPPQSARQQFVIKHKDLLSHHAHGMYHCNNISSNPSVQFCVVRSNIYVC